MSTILHQFFSCPGGMASGEIVVDVDLSLVHETRVGSFLGFMSSSPYGMKASAPTVVRRIKKESIDDREFSLGEAGTRPNYISIVTPRFSQLSTRKTSCRVRKRSETGTPPLNREGPDSGARTPTTTFPLASLRAQRRHGDLQEHGEEEALQHIV